ncbi:HNH endonuclease [Rhodovulum adriaticum]|uniref:HNH endonuclease n=2 Tax=Rhodovulum adriaticum TaxID=35804 RepID=A0A4R2NFL7_RHOAD|nr:hypothetical protein [Rhodovulum adriaticum]MBK1637172.1 hypothetical protein [Rhodovulum adriaticum]TCP19962.1 hypothetical protein EV656_12412 [Rhodovulum adriaticum]
MTTCEVHWRPSGGRGEFEFVPADSLMDRDVVVDFDQLGIRIDSEVYGKQAQGKPRLRKRAPNDRSKLHLPQLVMAVAGLHEPARSDKLGHVSFPLENKKFLVQQMDFDVLEDDGMTIVLAPLRASILHSKAQFQLDDSLAALAGDIANVAEIAARDPDLAAAITAHADAISTGVNTGELRRTADALIALKVKRFGPTNAGAVRVLLAAEDGPEVEAEQIAGKEGRILTRLHTYKERDRKFAKQVRDHYRHVHGGKLRCEACGTVPVEVYGNAGERAMEAHHTVPIEELQPDSVTLVEDMAMVCAGCHRVIHSQKPCLTIQEVRDLIAAHAP